MDAHVLDQIQTARLVLRRPRDSDVSAIFSGWANDPIVTKYMSWPRHESPAATSDFVRFSDAEWSAWPAGPYLIETRDSQELIGSTGFGFCSATDAEVGYVLAADSWGRGYATEALMALLELAPQLGLELLHASVHPDNAASCRVLEKCGFAIAPEAAGTAIYPNLPTAQSAQPLVHRLNLADLLGGRDEHGSHLDAAITGSGVEFSDVHGDV